MSGVTAIAATMENPFKAALDSAVNLAKLIGDFMYGTPERERLTYMFAIGLAVLGAALQNVTPALLQSCPV